MRFSSGAALETATSAPSLKVFAACVLERLPVSADALAVGPCELRYLLSHLCMRSQILMQPAQPWEEEHALWRRSEDLRQGFSKEYQSQVSQWLHGTIPTAQL